MGSVLYLVVLSLILREAGATQDATITAITRLTSGDVFTTDSGECRIDNCGVLNSASVVASVEEEAKGACTCQCQQQLPVFREDLHICVNDIHECALAPFVSGATSEKIPFVFLPLKGQLIYPEREITFTGIKTPICAVSGAQFLTETGWVDLRNPVDADVPFRLFRDDGRTLLQWVGEPNLRARMSGRLLLVHLLCRDVEKESVDDGIQTVFASCVAFRVAGTPTKYLHNISEVTFSADAHAATDLNEHGLSISEYIAIGICSILLGLIYVASVFLYLHIRKRRKDSEKSNERRDTQSLATAEEGIVKSNPLLGLGRHFSSVDHSYSDSGSSDTDITPDIIQKHDDRVKGIQITSALVHPQRSYCDSLSYSSRSLESIPQDSTSIERLPEENVSIVETIEGGDRSETVKAIGTTRRKLYFNPAYFEPELLLAPPPAALEFLTKIREVITIAKQKMACKRFAPSLLGIPEEDTDYSFEPMYESRPLSSRRGSMISLKRENSRRRTCSGCPGCEPQDLKALCGRLPEFPSLVACKSCTTDVVSESKQRSIQKWLEDVPVLKPLGDLTSSRDALAKSLQSLEPKKSKWLRSPTRSLSPEHISPYRALSPRPASERARSPIESISSRKSVRSQPPPKSKRAKAHKSKAPLPPLPRPKVQEELPAKPDGSQVPTLTKRKMEAVIHEFASQHGIQKGSDSSPEMVNRKVDYETDSLERNGKESEYEVSSSQPSPSLSTALPMAEEMTIRNAMIENAAVRTPSSGTPDDYELIVLNQADLYNIPEILQRNGYSLVSEVYVNNGYNFSSAPSTPSGSPCSTLERKKPKVKYNEEKPGKLTIEVKDCPDNYIRVEDSDTFEPDTLDRKPKTTMRGDMLDSLERPNSILLRTTGSFRKDALFPPPQNPLPFNRTFGSLREIYEFKTKNNLIKSAENLTAVDDEPSLITWKNGLEKDCEGKLLSLEERHSKRQRRIAQASVPPDIIPPPPHGSSSLYERPKPPRKVVIDVQTDKPPLPPKNESRSPSQKEGKGNAPVSPASSCDLPSSLSGASVSPNSSDYETVDKADKNEDDFRNIIRTEDIMLKNAFNQQFIFQASVTDANPLKTLLLKKEDPNNNVYFSKFEKTDVKKAWYKLVKAQNFRCKAVDSGYLSTDSNESKRKQIDSERDTSGAGSETDESLGDGHSESGAESVETHSVFFGSIRKLYGANSDSGTSSDFRVLDSLTAPLDDGASTDSETVSYTTVVPVGHPKSKSRNSKLNECQ